MIRRYERLCNSLRSDSCKFRPSLDMNVSNAINCSLPWPTVQKEKTVVAIYSTFAAVAIIAYFSAIIMIVKTRAYRLFTHRLTLYLAFGGVLLSLGNILQIVPVDLNIDDQSLVSIKAGLEGLCIFAGFFRQYTLFLQTLTVVCMDLSLHIRARSARKAAQPAEARACRSDHDRPRTANVHLGTVHHELVRSAGDAVLDSHRRL